MFASLQVDHSDRPSSPYVRKQKVTPWDKNGPQPALVELLETEASRQLLPTQGTALVPGCGTGYDVVLLARQGLVVTGLDISETAKAAADRFVTLPRVAVAYICFQLPSIATLQQYSPSYPEPPKSS